jgi:Hr1 repeat
VTTRGKLQNRRSKLNQVMIENFSWSSLSLLMRSTFSLSLLFHYCCHFKRKSTKSFDYGKQSNFHFSKKNCRKKISGFSSQGAENLYKATSNKKLKETINLELSFMNSTLQLLKEQLSELNSAVDVYQHEK